MHQPSAVRLVLVICHDATIAIATNTPASLVNHIYRSASAWPNVRRARVSAKTLTGALGSDRTKMKMSLLALLFTTLAWTWASSAAGTATIKLSDLPRHLETACASQAVRSALFSCKLSGPTAACCSGLDAVFANSSSASARCLCLPQVLYATATQASKRGLDILQVLQSCKANSTKRGNPFLTQWATDDHTICPTIPLDARPSTLLPELGDAVILLVGNSTDRPRWAWTNMLQFGQLMGEYSDLQTLGDRLFGVKAIQMTYLVIICMPVLYFVLHHVLLLRVSAVYRCLKDGDRLVVCQHAVYALVFSLSLVPQTVLACKSLYSAWTGSYLGSVELTVMLGVFISTRAVLYVCEACVCSVIKWSWLLIVHHLLFFTVLVMALWSQNASILGIGIVLDLFACHEAPLYLALIAYRLQWPVKLARGILRGACVWYVLTRVMQTVLLAYMIIGFAGTPAVNRTPEFIVTAVLCGAFTFIQAYTLVIYRAMDVKLSRKLAAASSSRDLPPPGAIEVSPAGSA